MAKKNHEKKKLEDLSLEELHIEIEENKKQIKRSTTLALSALVAVIALCMAWFVANNVLRATTSGIEAMSDNPFELASVGVRQTAEKDNLKNIDGSNILTEGTTKIYNKYIDIETGKEIETKDQEYHTGYSNLAWHLGKQENFVPGASGELEFYLIAKRDGLTSADITLDLKGYAKDIKESNTKLQNLIKGHLLFFRDLDDTYGYYRWLGENLSFTVNAPVSIKQGNSTVSSPIINGMSTFIKNEPYKVTIHWVWPQYFRNYIYTQRSTQGDLFTDAIEQGEDSEYKEFISFINNQKDVTNENSKLFYNSESISEGLADINNQMSDATLDACSKYYNQADEYIGTNVQYIYVQAQVEGK